MLYSVLFRFGHIRRSDQCAVYILYSKISTDPGLLKIRNSRRFVAVVIQFLIPLTGCKMNTWPTDARVFSRTAPKPGKRSWERGWKFIWPLLKVNLTIPGLIWWGTWYFVQNNTPIILPGDSPQTTPTTHYWTQFRSLETRNVTYFSHLTI